MIRRPGRKQETSETVVLATILNNFETDMDKMAEALQPSDFTTESHRLIFEAMLELHRRGKVSDIITVGEMLEEQGHLEKVGGRVYLLDLAMSIYRDWNQKRNSNRIELEFKWYQTETILIL